MSQSSHGGDGNATSTNQRGHRPGKSKHGTSSPDVFDSDNVVMGPQTPETPTKKRNGFLTGFTDKFSRSPSDTEPPNRKRRTDNRDASLFRTATVVQPPSRPPSASSDMQIESTDSSSTTHAPDNLPPSVPTQHTPKVDAAAKVAPAHKVTEDELVQTLKRCIQIAANITTMKDDALVFLPGKEVTAMYKTLGLLLELDTSDADIQQEEDEYEGLNDSMHAPKNTTPTHTPLGGNQRITRLESAVTSIASKFEALTLAVLHGQLPNTGDTQTSCVAEPATWGQPTTNIAPSTSYATGPIYKPAAKAKAIASFTARHHESRLIVNITPTPTREQQVAHSGPRIRDAINERLRLTPETNHMMIGLVSWSNLGSAIINTVEGLTAAELEPHAGVFTDLLPHTPDATFMTQTDAPWHKVTLNGVPTRGGSYVHVDDMDFDQPVTPSPKTLLDELLHYNGWLKNRKIIGEPRWISAPETLLTRDKSSVVIAFAKKEDADELIHRRGVFMFGHRASTRAYIDIPPLRHCTNCWKLDHTSAACKAQPRCRLCAADHPTAEHSCEPCGSVGAICEHTVVKCVHCPDSDSPHFADSFTCPYRRAYKGTAIASPKTKGGRRIRKPKPAAAPRTSSGNTQAPPPLAQPRPIPTAPDLRAAIHMTAKIGAPNATDEQIHAALEASEYDLGDTLTALLTAINRTVPDTNQPTNIAHD